MDPVKMNTSIPPIKRLATSSSSCGNTYTTNTNTSSAGGRSFSNPFITSTFLLQRPPPNPNPNPNPNPMTPATTPSNTLPRPNSLFISGCGTEADEAKALAACKSHKEAERLRRKRINGHLATLRTLLPNLLKTDKASLLGEVVRRVRELKHSTSHLTALTTPSPSVGQLDGRQEKLVPEDTDLVRMRRCDVNGGVVVATLSCEDRPGLLSDLSTALKSVKAKIIRAEIATVGGRTKTILWLQDGGGREGLAALSRALKVVVDRPKCSSAFGPALGLFGSKRQRLYR